jgi:hypothetical protein
MAKLDTGYALWVSMVSVTIDNITDINMVMGTFSAVDSLSASKFFKKYFYAIYDAATSLPVLGPPYGTITTVQSKTYPVDVEAIKKIVFLAQQVLPQAPATALSVTLQLPADVEKAVVAKDGINKLKLLRICGTINPESTSFDTPSFPTFSKKGMDLVLSQPCAG